MRNISKIKKYAKKFVMPSLNIYYISQNQGKLKIGFIISKKVCKKAVERNKIKRKIREFIRNMFSYGDFSILIKNSSIEIIMTELKNVIEKNINFFN
ncbi:MAG: ribonuclease P protein component [Candidatus Omnitrophica bacterium]|jgi:ribonuclease P protein component|nr:ribonuclease P protein component [Candidatus Omnitrophota bacterium]